MRAFSLLLASILLLAASAPAFAATDLDKFKNKVERSAPENIDVSPPVVCVCKVGDPRNQVGQLWAQPTTFGGSTKIIMYCLVLSFVPPGYWNSGAYAGGMPCPDWELLPK